MDETRRILSQSVVATIGAIVAIAAIIGGYYWYTHRTDSAAALRAAAPAVTAPADGAGTKSESAHLFPIDDHDSDHATKLDESDAKFLEAITHLGGWRASALGMLVPTNLIRHIVATVDALPHEKLPLAVLPTRSVPGLFRVSTSGKGTFIDASNARRYAFLIETFTALDTAQTASTYRHFYPLFQQAYQELGYPEGYFNDRLVEVIDELLETPEPKPPIQVIAPRAMFHYVDADLEALPAGQKILVRVGLSNENAIKAKLRDLRQAITAP